MQRSTKDRGGGRQLGDDIRDGRRRLIETSGLNSCRHFLCSFWPIRNCYLDLLVIIMPIKPARGPIIWPIHWPMFWPIYGAGIAGAGISGSARHRYRPRWFLHCAIGSRGRRTCPPAGYPANMVPRPSTSISPPSTNGTCAIEGLPLPGHQSHELLRQWRNEIPDKLGVVCVRFAVLRPPRYMFRHTPLSQQAGAGGAFDMPVQWRRGRIPFSPPVFYNPVFSTTWAPGESSDLCTCTMHVPFPSLRLVWLESEKVMAAKCAYVEKVGAVYYVRKRIPSAWKGGWRAGFCACRCGPRTGAGAEMGPGGA